MSAENGDALSTRELVRRLDHKLDCIAADVARLKLEDARRVGFYAGAKLGAQATLLTIAAAAGSGATKLLDYLAGR